MLGRAASPHELPQHEHQRVVAGMHQDLGVDDPQGDIIPEPDNEG